MNDQRNPRTRALSEAGVSIWLDDLSRQAMTSGDLAELIATRDVVGVTTNPSIFQAAIAGVSVYDEDIARLAGEGQDVEAVVDLADVFAVLEREGVEKFEKAWEELLSTVKATIEDTRG